MAKRELPFDPEAFAQWLMHGLKETVAYRIRQSFSKEKIVEALKSKIPNRNQVLHQLLRKGFEKDGFKFEEIRQGDAVFHVIRKRIREGNRRLILIPGFGDSPGSWLVSFGFVRRQILRHYDEILIIDFPGYLGFLSHHKLTPSMAMLQSVVKTVCDANPPHTLIGHSLGGWLAAKYAQQLCRPGTGRSNAVRGSDPQRIRQLILIAPSGLTPKEERQAFADFILEGQNISLKELLARVVFDPKPYQFLMKEEFRQFYAQPEIKNFIDSVQEHDFLDSDEAFAADHLSVIWGDHDRFVPARWMRHWIERYGPYTDAFLMTQTGHLPQLERPQTLAEVILAAIGLSQKSEGKFWKRIHSKKLNFNAALSPQTGTKQIPHLK